MSFVGRRPSDYNFKVPFINESEQREVYESGHSAYFDYNIQAWPGVNHSGGDSAYNWMLVLLFLHAMYWRAVGGMPPEGWTGYCFDGETIVQEVNYPSG